MTMDSLESRIISEHFGYEISKMSKSKKSLESFDIEKEASVDTWLSAAGAFSYNYDSSFVSASEVELIKTYRKLSITPDVELALNEIKNEIFIYDVPGKKAVELEFDESGKMNKSLIKKIKEEFNTVYELMEFQRRGNLYFDTWYIDGKIYLNKIVDKNALKEGIKRIEIVESLKIKKIKEYPQPDRDGIYDLSAIKEYFIYSDIFDVHSNVNSVQKTRGMTISKDSICFVDSGLFDRNTNTGISYLWKCIVPYNNLKLMEDSLVVYRVSRSPDRRVFYVDVGNLPKNKAEQYIRELMNKFKNKLSYDVTTGSIADRKNVLSMVEDFWMPRRDGGKGTEIITLPGGTANNVIDDVNYFKTKFFQSLNVPISRFQEQAPTFMFGKGIETNRDEYRFKKFLDKLRNQFVLIFEDILRTQLLLKNIITDDDWESIHRNIIWSFAEDNNFVEFKEAESTNNKLQSIAMADPFVGKYYSKKWVQKTILRMSDSEIDEMEDEISKEAPPPPPPGSDDSDTQGPVSTGDVPEQQTGPQTLYT